jgi:hypothetical protein
MLTEADAFVGAPSIDQVEHRSSRRRVERFAK